MVLAYYSPFRPDTGHSSINNAFCIENQGSTQLWELYHYNTAFSFISLPIVSLENIEPQFLKTWLGRAINLCNKPFKTDRGRKAAPQSSGGFLGFQEKIAGKPEPDKIDVL